MFTWRPCTLYTRNSLQTVPNIPFASGLYWLYLKKYGNICTHQTFRIYNHSQDSTEQRAEQNKDIPLRKVSWSGMKKAPEHIAARSISLMNQNLDERKKPDHLVVIGIRGLQLKYHEKSLFKSQQEKKNSLWWLIVTLVSFHLTALFPTKAVKSTFVLFCLVLHPAGNEAAQICKEKWKSSNQMLTHYECMLGSFCCC